MFFIFFGLRVGQMMWMVQNFGSLLVIENRDRGENFVRLWIIFHIVGFFLGVEGFLWFFSLGGTKHWEISPCFLFLLICQLFYAYSWNISDSFFSPQQKPWLLSVDLQMFLFHFLIWLIFLMNWIYFVKVAWPTSLIWLWVYKVL